MRNYVICLEAFGRVSRTSFIMEISSEMVITILPLFPLSVLEVMTNIIGVIEGVTEATASILKDISGLDIGQAARYGRWRTNNAISGIIDFPASLMACLLWQGVGGWDGFGPGAWFLFGSVLVFIATILMFFWHPKMVPGQTASD